ncbi:MAG: SCP2 sterol-binding domain-containing protein [Candidatus Helarchaeota archaeon]|nr:SCP2 sterol-binding domain-containing protein [Candidatus Helarchaeota archaeon]
MVIFPSEEYVTKLSELLNSSKEFEEAATGWEGDFLFTITPDENLNEEVRMYADLWNGKCREARIIPKDEEKETVFALKGPYSKWKAMLKKETDPIRAILYEEIEFKGDMSKVTSYLPALKLMIDILTSVETEFL